MPSYNCGNWKIVNIEANNPIMKFDFIILKLCRISLVILNNFHSQVISQQYYLENKWINQFINFLTVKSWQKKLKGWNFPDIFLMFLRNNSRYNTLCIGAYLAVIFIKTLWNFSYLLDVRTLSFPKNDIFLAIIFWYSEICFGYLPSSDSKILYICINWRHWNISDK